MKLIDRVGQRYSRLTVLSRAPNKSAKDTNARWVCRCDCGATCVAYGQDLARGKFKSCGCLNAERIVRHGMSRTNSYSTWKTMIQRCENPNAKGYKAYGARGITVCDEWHSFDAFVRDMGVRPKGYTLDRIDNDKGYFKDNCRWATTSQQNNNNRRNRRITVDCETRTIAEWAQFYGLKWYQIATRVKNGWGIEEAVTTPLRTPKKEPSP